MMTQYDARGRFVRRARYNIALWTVWTHQVPYGRIILED